MKIKGVIKALLSIMLGAGVGAGVVWNISRKEKSLQNNRIAKFVDYFNILDAWMKINEGKKTIETYFLENGIKTIAIYGVGKLGKHLIASLQGTSVEVVYGIDQKASVDSPIKCYGLEEEWPEVDAIVVTATFDFDNIESLIRHKVSFEIIPIDAIIFDVL